MEESRPNETERISSSSEDRFRNLLESAPDAMVIVDRMGRIVLANAQTERMFGYKKEELLGQTVELLVPEKLRGRHVHHRGDFHTHPRTRPMGSGLELEGLRKDGTTFPVEISLSPLDEGETSLVTAAIRDITERKKVEDALRQSEERFRTLVEEVKDYAIFLLDPDGRIQSWNAGAEKIKGYGAEEILGQHFSCFYAPEDLAVGKPEEALRLAALDGRWEEEGWRVRKDGSRFWANVVITALRDGQGRLTGFTKVTRDITERKQRRDAFLLEITNALVSNLDTEGLLNAISSCLHQVRQFDFATVALYDGQAKILKVRALGPGGMEGMPEEKIEVDGKLPASWVFTTGKPLLFDGRPDQEWRFALRPSLQQQGIQSGCWLPLMGRKGIVGTLNIFSKRAGAFSEEDLALLGPFANQVAIAVENAIAFEEIAAQKEKLAEEKLYLEDELRTEFNFEEIVGQSRTLQNVLRQIENVAPTDSTVLILGETGTGKELLARAVHSHSPRRDRTFVRVNCASIPAGLLESELFGHEKGAFTGAITRRIGRIELANQGTLFLDEVGDIPLELQSKLLRFLQEKEFERLGSSHTLTSDARIVAATNRDLGRMAAEGEFRRDLYYRLNVFPIVVPPLRERSEDIPLLVQYFLLKYSRRMKRAVNTVSPEAMRALMSYSWPGNVRELEHLIERAVILSSGTELKLPPFETEPNATAAGEPSAALEDVERQHILRVLRQTRGKIAGPGGAAEQLGMNRTTLNSRMRKLGISRQDISQGPR